MCRFYILHHGKTTPLSLKTEALVSRARVIGFPVLYGLSSMVERERPFILIVVSPARAETPVFWVIPGGVSGHLIREEQVLTHWYGPDVPRNIW